MATVSTGGPAKDDTYTFLEDSSLFLSYYNTQTYVLTLDVIANDGGNSSTIVYSVDDGNGNLTKADQDLAVSDVGGTWEATASGNSIQIVDNKVQFKLSGGRDINSLSAGEVLTDQFVYAIRQSNGNISQSKVMITLTGTNDAPVVKAIAQTNLSEQTNNAPLTSNIAISFTDADLNDVGHTASITSFSKSGVTAGLGLTDAQLQALITLSSVTKASGSSTGSLNAAFSAGSSAFDYLAAGQKLTLNYTVTIDDHDGGVGSKTFAIEITGTNDAATVNAIAQTNFIEQTDSTALTANIGVTFTDVDLADVGHTASITGVTRSGITGGLLLSDAQLQALITPGIVTKAAGSSAGSVNLAVSAPSNAFDYLATGEKLTLTYNVAIDDHDGGIGSKSFVVEITGTNDAPILNSIAQTNLNEPTNTLPLTANIGVTFSDVDVNDVGHTASITGFSKSGVTTGLALNDAQLQSLITLGTVTKNAGSTTGSVNAAFSAGSSAFDYLAAGQKLTLVYTVTVDDHDGGTNTKNFVIEINGTNDVPVIGGVSTGSVQEDVAVSSGNLTTGGMLTISDVDQGQSSFVPQTNAGGVYGHFTLASNGAWTYVANNSQTAIQRLGAAQSITDSFTAFSSDGTANQTITIVIHGTNDAAVITGDTSGTAVEAGGVANGTAGSNATGDLNSTDVDNPADAWTVVSTATAGTNGYGSYTIDATGHWTYAVDNANAAVQALNAGDTLTDTFSVTTVDGTAQLVTVTIDGTNDAAVITGDTSGTAVEAGGVANGTAGSNATGDLNSTDVDNPADAWTVVSTATAGTNGYGSYTIDATGHWTYAVDNANAAVQALNAGDTLTDTFSVTTVDGTAQLVTVTIDGTNDAAVITGDTSGTAVEAGGVANGTAGSNATGDLNSTDVDNPADAWTVVSTATAGTNGYGSYTIDATGHWTYAVDNANAAVQALNAGDTLTDTFSVTTVDGTAQLVTVTIDGTNDAAVITGDTSGTAVEAGGVANGTAGSNATGDLNSTDVDNPADAWTVVSTATAGTNGYGSYTIDATGHWTYAVDNANAAVQALNAGDTLTDTFSVTTVDGTAQLVTVTIDGTNDAAVITGDTSGTAVEAGGVANGTAGSNATGDLNSTDVDNPADAWTVVSTATAGTNGYGSYTIDATGHWTYAVDNANAAVQALNAGDTLTDTFSVTTVDGTAQLVTVTIDGTNDAAVITGDTSGTAVEAGGVANGTAGSNATGDLNSTDVDNPADAWTVVSTATAGTNGYGSYTIDATGHWTYAVDNANAAVQALNAGDTLTDTFSVTTVDGTAQLVTVTIDGTNDAAVITGDTSGTAVEAGGVANGTAGSNATGDLNSTDVDNPADAWTVVSTATAGTNGYGSYTIDATGHWTYAVDNANAAVQALNAGDTLTDTFSVTTVDGTAQLVTVTIDGTNDAAVITGDTSGTAVEAGGVANGTAGSNATGDLNSTDVDNPADAWTVVSTATAGTNGYGSYTIDATGHWTYAVDNANAAVQALNAGDTLTDTFSVTTVDGTAQLVTVTIDGTNDAAVITGDTSGTAVEAGGVANGTAGSNATGDLNSTDVDNPADAWTVVSTATAGTNGYGSYTIDATGHWTYAVDNANAAVQALNAGDTLTDTFSVTTVDGTAQLVTVTIDGTNDAAVITGDTSGTAVEAGGVANGTAGSNATGDLNSTDVDNPADAWTVVSTATAGTNGYGSYTIDATGHWTYAVDNANAAVQALNAGDTLTDTFSVTTVDGTAQLVTVTIDGTNDAAVITGDTSGTAVEAGGVANGTAGSNATGDLNSTDVDNPADAWTVVSTATAGTNGYGSYTIDATGHWTYAVDNANAAVQALNAGDTLTDTFSVTTVDGTAQLVTVTIDGTNDAAVITGDTSGTAVEAGGVANGTAGSNATGDLNSTDVDNPADAWTVVSTATAGTNGYGSYTIDATGHWTYAVDNANAAVQALNAGDTLTDTFSVTTVDGTAQLVTVTIDGTNDAAVITGDTSGTAVEAGGVANGTAGSNATGDLNSTDVDNPADAWTVVSTATAGTNGYGSYTIDATGHWTYAVDNANAAVQALNAGDTLTDTFSVTTVDGTAQLVTVTIDGTNDAAVITGDTSGTAVEAGGVANGTAGSNATGDLNSTDVDNPADAWTVVSTATAGTNGYGSYTIDATGHWTYAVDNANAAVQALNAGDTLTDTFSVTTVDGTAQLVTVTIDGTNDAAVITGDTSGTAVEAGGVANGTAGSNATGDLNSTDVDNPADAWTVVSTATAGTNGYGSYTIDATGHWTYAVDNANAAVQALNSGQTLTDTFAVTTIDGTSKTVSVIINGANDAAVISGSSAGSVIEAGGIGNASPGTPTATGTLTDTDVDNTPNTFTAVAAGAATLGGYGTYQMNAGGTWTYTLNNNNGTVQALNSGQTLTDTFAVTTIDGTNKTVSVIINGANDAAVISGSSAGSVIEAGGIGNASPGTPTATGTLTDTDVDNTPNTFTAVAAGAATLGGYGTYQMNAGGTWTYTLNNNNGTVQALNSGQTLTDTFAVTTIDGTNKTVSVIINGANDAAVISGAATANLTESNAIQSTSGTLNVTDVDSSATFVPQTNATGNNGYGKFSINSAGAWTYTMNTAHDEFAGGTTYTDSITVATADGTTKVLTVNILGTIDAVATVTSLSSDTGASASDFVTTSTSQTVSGNYTGALQTGEKIQVSANGTTWIDAVANGVSWSASGVTLSPGTGTLSVRTIDAANNTIAGTGHSYTLDNSAPQFLDNLSSSGAAGNQFAFVMTKSGNNFTFRVTGSDNVGISSVNIFNQTTGTSLGSASLSGGVYSLTVGNIVNNGQTFIATIVDAAGNTATKSGTVSSNSFAIAPAGIAGSPINLGLQIDEHTGQSVTITIANLAADWILNGGIHNADSTWTIVTTDPSAVTVTTPATFAGAELLEVTMTWTDAQGVLQTAFVADNVEAYAPGNPIFALSGDDNLTGSVGADLFVIAQPIGTDRLFTFDAAQDRIDLVAFAGFASFADVAVHLANDSAGNAVLELGNGQRIVFEGVDAAALGAENFIFNELPAVTNAGTIAIGDGASLPLSGLIENSGTIALQSSGAGARLELIQHGITLLGGGHVTLSDHSGNVIAGTLDSVTLNNVDNTISGAGEIGVLTLSNAGAIVADGSHALVIDTGAHTIVNSGTLSAIGAGGLAIGSSVENSGVIAIDNSSLALTGSLTGHGTLSLDGHAVANITGTVTNAITLAADAEVLLGFGDAGHITGSITGFDHNDEIDFLNLDFNEGSSVTYLSNAEGTGGELHISNGTQTADLVFSGSYDASLFHLAADTDGSLLLLYGNQVALG
ncbi:VCBS domain-containing protein [Novosphingobium sp. G106]|uniref:beta strand repeat-containing protein n=1 Tax=Novosphingobium sp. G106 TaxID=2849500 RepID=UPI001C2CF3B8|nr:VCBS domain-containing protein [Novosphingobium sp. G106]MBV1688456.1 VCBS domain-containing protein [Novosphingobium sp. G106]